METMSQDIHLPPNFNLRIFAGDNFLNVIATCFQVLLSVSTSNKKCPTYITAVTSENERYAIFDGPTIHGCCNPSWVISGVYRSPDSSILDSIGWSLSATVMSVD